MENLGDSAVGGGGVVGRVVRQSAMGQARSSTTDARWSYGTTEMGMVAKVFAESRKARVRLFGHPAVELDSVPWLSDLAIATGTRVLVSWIGGNRINPTIVGVADAGTREHSSSTRRPQRDLVPHGDGERHVFLYPTSVPQADFILDIEADRENWEAHWAGGYMQVVGQQVPDSERIEQSRFDTLPHTLHVSVDETLVDRVIPIGDGRTAWRIRTQTRSEDGSVTISLEHGRASDGQRFAGSGKPFQLRVDSDGIVRMNAGDRPVLVLEDAAAEPPAGTKALDWLRG